MPHVRKRELGIEKTLAYEEYNMTQQEVADYFGISRPMAGLIETRAKEKFKKGLAARGITIDDLFWRD